MINAGYDLDRRSFGEGDPYLNLHRHNREHAQQRYTHYFNRLKRYYDYYRGTFPQNFSPGRSNVHIPLIFSIIETLVSRLAQATFGSFPAVQFTSFPREGAAIARKNELLISAQWMDSRSFEKAVDFYTMATLYGVGIAKIFYREDAPSPFLYREQNPETGQEEVRSISLTTFNGPDWAVKDILDFWPQPGKTRLADMDWVEDREFIDYDRLLEQAMQGVYDLAPVKSLAEMGPPAQVEYDYKERRSYYRTGSDWEALRNERLGKPVELVHRWGYIPRELVGKRTQGARNVVITVANNQKVIRIRPNYYGELPYFAFHTHPDPHFFHSAGVVEIVEKMQAATNRLANQKLDAIDRIVDPMWAYNTLAGINTKQLISRPSGLIGVEGPVDDSALRPIFPDIRGLNLTYSEMGQLWQWMQQGLGVVEDILQGGAASKEQTAREYLGRQEGVLTRLGRMVRSAETSFVEPLADGYVRFNRMFLPTPYEVSILGMDAILNPLTGYQLPTQEEDLTLQTSDLMHNYRARAVSGAAALSKASHQQNFMALMGLVGNIPGAAQTINLQALLKMGIDILGFRDYPELFEVPESQKNAQLTPEDQAIQQAGGLPGGEEMM